MTGIYTQVRSVLNSGSASQIHKIIEKIKFKLFPQYYCVYAVRSRL